jgi:hypothetical protein
MTPLNLITFIIIVITSMVILVFRDWRINTISLGVQYLAVFGLVTLSWPVGMAVIKIVVGWMAVAAIGFTCLRHMPKTIIYEPPAAFFFRGLLGLVMIFIIFVSAPILQNAMFPSLNVFIVQSGLMLIGMALMQLGTSSEPYLNIISLLSLLAGFEIIHAGIELSTLLTGLMVIVNLGLALAGVYFIIQTNEQLSSTEKEDAK